MSALHRLLGALLLAGISAAQQCAAHSGELHSGLAAPEAKAWVPVAPAAELHQQLLGAASEDETKLPAAAAPAGEILYRHLKFARGMQTTRFNISVGREQGKQGKQGSCSQSL